MAFMVRNKRLSFCCFLNVAIAFYFVSQSARFAFVYDARSDYISLLYDAPSDYSGTAPNHTSSASEEHLNDYFPTKREKHRHPATFKTPRTKATIGNETGRLELEETLLRKLYKGQQRNYADKPCNLDILRERDPVRIPGYLDGCHNSTFYGYVMRDLVNRFLPSLPLLPPATSSKAMVLVVTPGAENALKETEETPTKVLSEEDLIKRHGYSVGKSFIFAASKRGHHVVAVDGTQQATVDQWWEQPSNRPSQDPLWLTVFDPATIGAEDRLVEGASRLIQEAPISYIVYRVSSQLRLSRNGLNASKLLLDAGYGLQILSASHANPQGERNNRRGPNSHLRNYHEVEKYLIEGETRAFVAEGRQAVFRSYLFATKGLDLAIPSRREFMDTKIYREQPDFVIDNTKTIPYKQCPKSQAQIKFVSSNPVLLEAQCYNRRFPISSDRNSYPKNVLKEIWYSGESLETSEAVCIECVKMSVGESLKGCTTRVLQSPRRETPIQKNVPNFLVIRIPHMSRAQFKRSFRGSSSFLAALNYTQFEKYTAVGGNQQSNHDALFQGLRNPSKHTRRNHPFLWDAFRDAGYKTLVAENGCVETSTSLMSSSHHIHGQQLRDMFCHAVERPNCVGETKSARYLFRYFMQFNSHLRATPWAAFLSLVDSAEDTGTLAGTLDIELDHLLDSLDDFMTMFNRINKNTIVVIVSDLGLNYGAFSQSFAGLRERMEPILYMKVPKSLEETIRVNRKMYTTPFDLYQTIRGTLNTTKAGSVPVRLSPSPGLSLFSHLPESRSSCERNPDIPNTYCSFIRSDVMEKKISLELPSPPSMLSFFADIPKSNKHQIRTKFLPQMPKRAEVFPGCICSTNKYSWTSCDKHPWGDTDKPLLLPQEYFILVDCPKKPMHFELRIVRNNRLIKRTSKQIAENPYSSRDLPNILFLEMDSVSLAHADRHFPKTRELLKRFRIKRSGDDYKCSFGICSADFSSHVSLVGASSIPNQVAALSGCVTSSKEDLCGWGLPKLLSICHDPTKPHYGLRLERISAFTGQAYWCPTRQDESKAKSPWLFKFGHDQGYINYFGEEFCYDGSPYVAQKNVFPIFYFDIESHVVNCRLAELRNLKENLKTSPKYLWSLERPEEPCLDRFSCGYHKARIALEHIERMWDTYSDRPKLAFLNALAGHNYNFDWARMYLMAERYDEYLASFLESMLTREDANSTVIIIRADHGLQRGPTAMDYGLQLEHNRPWTEILVPESLSGFSKSVFFQNQNRLTSGFDLYHTMRDLMTVVPEKNEETGLPEKSIDTSTFKRFWRRISNFYDDDDDDDGRSYTPPAKPDWTYNLLKSTVPHNRTCLEARVDPHLCREKSITPDFGACNMLDRDQKRFCPRYERASNEILPSELSSSRSFTEPWYHTARYNSSEICDNTSLASAVYEDWKFIDDTLKQDFSTERVSGGIFLYPRQAALITALVRQISNLLRRTTVVCETGFGSGHSLSMFMNAAPNVSVVSFDKFDRPYQLQLWKYLREKNSKNHLTSYVVGDSCQTVPTYLREVTQCDVLHGSSLCKTDNIDLVENSPCGVLLTSTAMSTLTEPAVYFGPKAQWRQLRERGCITKPVCFQEDDLDLERDFVFAKRGTSYRSKFCIAMTTGRCQKGGVTLPEPSGCDSSIYRAVSKLGLNQLCPKYQVEAPP